MADSVLRVERPPAAEEYALLRREVGWHPVSPETAARGLAGALYSLCLETSEGELVGCGRVVGDGGIYFYLQDIIVRAPWRGRGYGETITRALLDYVERQSGSGTFVALMAAEGVEGFYERFGFERRPEGRPGMYLPMEPDR